jgi:hypothetical protein
MQFPKVGKRNHYKGQFLQHDLWFITQRAADFLELLLSLPEYQESDRRGGVLVLVPDESCTTHFSAVLGEIPPGAEYNYRAALLKCQALREHSEAKSTFEIRDGDSNIFGGGISFEVQWEKGFTLVPFLTATFPVFKVKSYIAFSGLSEHADEALVLMLAVDAGWINEDQARKIANASTNPYFKALLKASQ